MWDTLGREGGKDEAMQDESFKECDTKRRGKKAIFHMRKRNDADAQLQSFVKFTIVDFISMMSSNNTSNLAPDTTYNERFLEEKVSPFQVLSARESGFNRI